MFKYQYILLLNVIFHLFAFAIILLYCIIIYFAILTHFVIYLKCFKYQVFY